ncbi:hypothetical protein KXD40_005076 [Peronospora effusa]|nr:hypothetical protein KXD40_005076 [Peronospora effusa]
MATHGAFLAPVLVPLNSCFVNLPLAFVQTFLSRPELMGPGSIILELSWETIDGYIQRVCVGWIGGIIKDRTLRRSLLLTADTKRYDVCFNDEFVLFFTLSATLLKCRLNLHDYLDKTPQSYIGVHVIETLPIARQVNVEPCTPDDWELIQLHAGAIETELLRQVPIALERMCVVNENQVSPIWINQHTLIRVRVSLSVGMYVDFVLQCMEIAVPEYTEFDASNREHARLTPASEIIVAPKERPPQATDNGLSRDLYYEQSLPLLVQVDVDALQNDTVDEVWVHPESLVMLDGALFPNAPVDAQEAPVVVLWCPESKLITENNEQSEAARKQPVCYVARLKACSGVVRGHIIPNRGVIATLGITTHASVYLRVLRVPELSPTSVTLCVNLESHDESHSALADRIRQSFLRWASSAEHSHIICSGSVLHFDLDNEEVIQAIAEVQYDAEETFSVKQLEDIPVGALHKYTVLGGSKGSYVLSMDEVAVQNAVGTQRQVLEKLETRALSTRTLNMSIVELSRSAKPYAMLMKAVRPVLSRDALAARVIMGVKPSGCALIYGERGSGKSTYLRAIVHDIQRSSKFAAFATTIECRNLRGLKMEAVKSRLTDLFKEAATHAPALIVLDNLDALVPEENESAGAANEQSRRIAELLLVLMNHNCQRMQKSTGELNASFKRECEAINGLPHSQKKSARKKLLETIGSAMQSKSVVIVAAARSDTSVHKTLRCCGLFDRPIRVSLPDAGRREIVIREMLQMKVNAANSTRKGAKGSREIVIDPSIDFGLLSSLTEGYSLRDLSGATDRALHQTYKRHALLQPAKGCEVAYKVQQSDFVEGIEDFQPTALIGVDLFKSSVKWSDVGGLKQVRTVLKDTLELPTRYAKLYESTPIKLPAGMLLYGPPGCGKTLLASAVAHECGLNFISVKGPEVLNKYIGASEQAIRDLFARAGSAAPSVLFLDEFDSIAPRRGADNTGVTDRLVNQLLTFLDGVEAQKGVYVLAATSRPDMIDPALLRPGRLDKSFYCGFPNEEERLDILRAVSKDMDLSTEALEYLSEIASDPKSAHFSGADLQAIMYSAQLELVHEKLNGNNSTQITKAHVQMSFQHAKPSTSDAARFELERLFSNFSKVRKTDFSIADATVSTTSELLKSHIAHQRTALA